MPKPIAHLVDQPNAELVAPALPGRLASAVGQVLAAARLWRRSRQAMREISSLDDRLLADLGLSRSDVNCAVLAASDRNPVQMLKDARFINATHRFRR